jgi:hypothetical protein
MTLNKNDWAGHIRAEMARKRISVVDLTKALQEHKNKPRSPSYPTVSRWIDGACTIAQAELIESIIDNWKL